eukprot:3689290-Prymnesium_polylepis.1
MKGLVASEDPVFLNTTPFAFAVCFVALGAHGTVTLCVVERKTHNTKITNRPESGSPARPPACPVCARGSRCLIPLSGSARSTRDCLAYAAKKWAARNPLPC